MTEQQINPYVKPPYKQVAAVDAIGFTRQFVEAVKDGYYLDAAESKYPLEHPNPMVFMFAEPQVAVHKKAVGMQFKEVTHTNFFEFLKLLQQAVIEGYSPNFDSVHFGVVKYAKMERVTASVVDVEQVKQPKAAKPAKAPKAAKQEAQQEDSPSAE